MADLRSIWHSDGTAVGAWISLRDPFIAEAAARAGFDYVCLDLQHGLCSYADVETMGQAIELGGSAMLARIPWHDHWMIGRVLDAGGAGVIVPMVNTAEEAERVAQACRYAPVGNRSIGPTAVGFRVDQYSATANEKVLCIVMIETAQAVANIDEILSVPGVDGVYIGPADLSLSLGLPPASDHADPRFVGALETVVEACGRHGVVPGIHTTGELAATRRAQGFRMFSTGYDIGPLQAGLAAGLAAGRAAG